MTLNFKTLQSQPGTAMFRSDKGDPRTRHKGLGSQGSFEGYYEVV